MTAVDVTVLFIKILKTDLVTFACEIFKQSQFREFQL